MSETDDTLTTLHTHTCLHLSYTRSTCQVHTTHDIARHEKIKQQRNRNIRSRQRHPCVRTFTSHLAVTRSPFTHNYNACPFRTLNNMWVKFNHWHTRTSPFTYIKQTTLHETNLLGSPILRSASMARAGTNVSSRVCVTC